MTGRTIRNTLPPSPVCILKDGSSSRVFIYILLFFISFYFFLSFFFTKSFLPRISIVDDTLFSSGILLEENYFLFL